MALYFITGQSGTGKSTICHQLQAKGYEAYDSDDNLARWINKETGYVHPKSSVKKAAHTPDFLQAHDWKIPRPAVTQLAEQAMDKPIFLCGVGGNEAEIGDLFKATFALVIDDETLTQRLITRTTNDWGKQPHELALTLSWQQQALNDYQKSGHIIIDATQPLQTVVDEILLWINRLEQD